MFLRLQAVTCLRQLCRELEDRRHVAEKLLAKGLAALGRVRSIEKTFGGGCRIVQGLQAFFAHADAHIGEHRILAQRADMCEVIVAVTFEIGRPDTIFDVE